MFPLMRATPMKTSRDTTAAASKIKQKILNTSSFFKVSLKTNNRALAAALEIQKQRRSLLEKEVVRLQKRVEALCFELAARKYRHRKLLQILKVHHSEVLELLSDLECPAESQDLGSCPTDAHVDFPGQRLGDPPPSQVQVLSCIRADAAGEIGRPGSGTGVGASGHVVHPVFQGEEAGSTRHSQMAPPTSSLRAEQDQPPVEVPRSVPVQAVLALQDPVSQDLPAEPRQERTVLLNTSMEMTVCNAAEIITVETKAKKTVRSRKSKDRLVKNRDETRDASDPTDPPTVLERLSPGAQCKRPGPTRIPKLGFRQEKVKPPSPPEPCETLPDLDEYFSNFSLIGFEEKSSKVTRRKSRTKVRTGSSVKRKTVVSRSPDRADSSQTRPPVQRPHEDEGGPPESGQAQHPSPGGGGPETSFRAVTFSRGSHKSRCRSTFVVTVVGDADGSDRDSIPPPGPDGCTKSRSSGKRRRTATQELCGGEGLMAPPLVPDHHATVGADRQKRKRARREEAARSEEHWEQGDEQNVGRTEKVKTDLGPEKEAVLRANLLVDSPATSASQPAPAAGSRKLRGTFVVSKHRTPDRASNVSIVRSSNGRRAADETGGGWTGDLLMDELPPWLGVDFSTSGADEFCSGMEAEEADAAADWSSSEHEASHRAAPAGRVLTTLTNTVANSGTPQDGEASGRTRRCRNPVSYKEPPLNRKMRREASSQDPNGPGNCKKRSSRAKFKVTD